MGRYRSKWYFSGIIFLLFTSSWFTNVTAQMGDIAIENKIDKSSVKIGDLITYTLTVTHDESVEVKLPGRAFIVLDTAFQFIPDDALNISDYQIYEPQEQAGKIVEKVEYVFSPFLVGKFMIAALTVQFKSADDTTYHQINAEPIEFVVESMKPSESGDIRDIKSQWEIELDIWTYLTPILISVFVLALIILAIIMYRRWRAGKALLPVLEKPKRPPHEIALEQLDQLVQSDLFARGEFKEFYIIISDIVRRYIEGCYFIVAIEMTTTQLIQNMRHAGIDDDIVELVQTFLTDCDFVKFAKYQPSAEENQQVIQSAYEIVHRTKIVLEVPTATQAETATATAETSVPAALVSAEQSNDAEVINSEEIK